MRKANVLKKGFCLLSRDPASTKRMDVLTLPANRCPKEDLIVIGIASGNFLETVVKYFMLLSENVLLGSCPVFSSSLWTDCSSSCLVLK